MDFIAKPFGMLLMWLYEVTANYGIAVILFALIVKLILMPFQMKSKKSMMRTSLLQERMKEIEKKHGANKQKYNEEVQKLYQEEGISPMSGCIWSLIPFPILIALYQAIRYPLTTMMGVAKDLLAEGGAIAAKLTETGFVSTMNQAYIQIEQSQWITRHWEAFEGLSDKLQQLDYSFLGLDLGMQPKLAVLWDAETYGAWGPERIAIAALLLIPVLAAVLTWLQSKVSSAKPKVADGEEDPTAKTMGTMNIVMPLITLYFAYIMPAALGVYWIAGSVFAIVQDLFLNKVYGKKIEAEFAAKNAERIKKKAEIDAKRAEAEKRRAENAPAEKNTNTSKKKSSRAEREQQREKAQEYERKKAGEEPAYEPSRVGDRKYARGRAYDPDRYTKSAEEAVPAEETEELLPEVAEVVTEEVEEPVEETVEEEILEEEEACDEEEETEAE
ncbi:MAG: membrane protein insertase YidC [Oscillospiraceae bacterium]|nr:membrane protein insertase YidC [Oscillospiraceae bacterium]